MKVQYEAMHVIETSQYGTGKIKNYNSNIYEYDKTHSTIPTYQAKIKIQLINEIN